MDKAYNTVLELQTPEYQDAWVRGLFAFYRASQSRVPTGGEYGGSWLKRSLRDEYLCYILTTRAALAYLFSYNRWTSFPRPYFTKKSRFTTKWSVQLFRA